MTDSWSTPAYYAPAQPYAAPQVGADGRGPLREVVAGLVSLLFCLFLGAPIGLIWAALRPSISAYTVSQASESALRPQFGADMKYAGLSLLGGLLAGVVAWLLTRHTADPDTVLVTRRHQGYGVAVGLAAGGILAALVARHVGAEAAHPENLKALTVATLKQHQLQLTGSAQDQNEFFDLLRFRLRSTWALVAFPVAASFVFAGLMSWRPPVGRRARP